MSASQASEAETREDSRRIKDEQEGRFCESLLGLMQRTGRFEYLDFPKKREREQIPSSMDGKRAKESDVKRFSWSR